MSIHFELTDVPLGVAARQAAGQLFKTLLRDLKERLGDVEKAFELCMRGAERKGGMGQLTVFPLPDPRKPAGQLLFNVGQHTVGKRWRR